MRERQRESHFLTAEHRAQSSPPVQWLVEPRCWQVGERSFSQRATVLAVRGAFAVSPASENQATSRSRFAENAISHHQSQTNCWKKRLKMLLAGSCFCAAGLAPLRAAFAMTSGRLHLNHRNLNHIRPVCKSSSRKISSEKWKTRFKKPVNTRMPPNKKNVYLTKSCHV